MPWRVGDAVFICICSGCLYSVLAPPGGKPRRQCCLVGPSSSIEERKRYYGRPAERAER